MPAPIYIEQNGQRTKLTTLARERGLDPRNVVHRYSKAGWSLEEALEIVPHIPSWANPIIYEGRIFTTQDFITYAIDKKLTPLAIPTLNHRFARFWKQGVKLTTKRLNAILVGDSNELIYSEWWLYIITCIPTGERYVGITVNPNQRWRKHINQGNGYLKEALEKYGEDQFTYEVRRKYETRAEAKEAENRYITRLHTMHPNGLNAKKGGSLGALGNKKIKYQDKWFSSIRALERHLKTGHISYWKRKGFSLHQAVEKSLTMTSPYECFWNGETFNSMREVADKAEVDYLALVSLVSGYKYSIEDAIKYLRKPILGKRDCACCKKSFEVKRHRPNKIFCSRDCKNKGVK